MSKYVAQRVIFSIFVPDVALVESIGGFPKSSPIQKTFSKMDPPKPPTPQEIAAAAVQRRRFSGQRNIEGSTSLTGQSGSSGQANVSVPTLLGG